MASPSNASSEASRNVRLLGQLLPGLIALVACVLWDAPWQQLDVWSPSELLQGASPCVWSTGGDFYSYPFTAYWNFSAGGYGWEVLIANRSKAVAGTDAGRRFPWTRAYG